MQLEVIHNPHGSHSIAPNWPHIRLEAAKAFKDHCTAEPWTRIRKAKLLTEPGANTKLAKGFVPIYGLTLAPAGSSGYQLCPWRSPECERACLGITAGRSKFSNVREARIAKTQYLMQHPYEFFRQLYQELANAREKHGPAHFAFRSNVLSDIPWESIAPEMYWFSWLNYDYTKSLSRCLNLADNPKRSYALDLTLSFSGHNWIACEMYLHRRGKVAMVFNIHKDEPLPEFYKDWPVVDGDNHDLRIDDPSGCIVGLRAKGSINKASAFVVSTP